ncbi:hypothetical protein AB0I06_16560 [Streptomyces sp. NPDC050674]|uniref:hypothetical protein n=1 Tax=Streptomyces sp. NPDC050674 TaxID=3157216 RepID=UPI00343C7926
MRSRLHLRAALVLISVIALQGGSTAMADDRGQDTRSASIDPFTPFMSGASALAAMAEPFYNAITGSASPQR